MGRRLEDGIGVYKYITVLDDGKYRVKRDNVHYGVFERLEDALWERDLLMDCDWDYDEFVNRENPTKNPYDGIELPDWSRYITKQGKYYTVQKTLDGVQKRFGYYKTYNEAVNKRNELIVSGWK